MAKTLKNKRNLPKGVSTFIRGGKERTRFRQHGRTVYLPPFETAAFWPALEAAKAGNVVGEGRAKPLSVNALLAKWFATNAFQKGGAVRQARAQAILAAFKAEFGDKPVASFKWHHIEALLAERAIKQKDPTTGRMVGGTAASSNLKKELQRAFQFAVDKLEWIKSNPVQAADGVVHQVIGRHCWTDGEIDRYRDTHPVGTHARAALEIMLWTAQRGGDAHLFGPQHLTGNQIKFHPSKQKAQGVVQTFDAAPALLEALNALPTAGTTAYLLTGYGKPYASSKAFQNKVREWCDLAGLPHCTAHGLRAAAARRLAENGGTQQEVLAVGGWSSDKAAAPYLRAASKAKMARSGTAKVVQFEADRAAELAPTN